MASALSSPLEISHNCKQIAVKLALPNVPSTTFQLTIASGTTSEVIPITYEQGTILTYNANLETAGVVTATVTASTGATIAQVSTVATCQIDCCIAKLVESAITCTCKCDKCKEELDRAEKVFLLLQAAVYAAEVDGNIKDATEKYAKANEMCTEVCACGC